MKNNRGQTFVEFFLVFIVLFLAALGTFALYKNVWEKRYKKTASHAGIVQNAGQSLNSQGYVK